MTLLTTLLDKLPEFHQMLEGIDGGRCPVALSGLSAVHRAHFAAGLYAKTQRPVVLICANESEGQRLSSDLMGLLDIHVPVLCARPFVFHSVDSLSRQWEHRRLSLLRGLSKKQYPIVIATIDGLLQRTITPTILQDSCVTLSLGDTMSPIQLAEQLTLSGYTRCDQVEGVGQFSLRGGILDVYSPGMDHPIRMDFFGDDLDAMGIFDPLTQRRIENITQAQILPATEVLPQLAPGGLSALIQLLKQQCAKAEKQGNTPLAQTLSKDFTTLEQGCALSATDRYISIIYPQFSTGIDYIPSDACVIFSECSRVADGAKTWQWQLDEDIKTLLQRGELNGSWSEFSQTFSQLNRSLAQFPVIYLDSFTLSAYPTPPKTLLSVIAKQLPSFGHNLDTAAADLAGYQGAGMATLVLVSSEQRSRNLQSLLRDRGIQAGVDFRLKTLPQQGHTVICVGSLSAGFEYPQAKIAILAEGQGAVLRKSAPKKSVTNRERLKSYADLSTGDLVVHEHHGVGRYQGMTKMPVDGIEKDYIKIAYADSDILYVPATQLDLVSKYIGGDQDAIAIKKLSKLGGTDWEKARTKAKKAVANLAKGLIALYAKRKRQAGFAFSPDSPWQTEFEQQFEYTETEDQLRCVQEIKLDMERGMPMDRLLCGDVGYGKTEVAFRAIMKCILDGKQAAILVPTTVLARQHFLTALKRFQKYPVTVDVVSRFRTPAQMKDTLRRVSEGQVDLLIGTHRLFQKDLKFKDLGILVVDEEQRFGVSHKEKLKERFAQVDVLTLSATPIPRTLNMALSGIRDMSTLEEPPENRQPVQTYVLEHDWGVLADAMRRELERDGQVFYLHNRVETIDRTASRIRAILGEDTAIGVAHGQMGQDEIDHVMGQMTDGTLNILVCTTIIETGIDLPNANTLIIQDADKLGLAQLHQIRGRVGRFNRRAYAYLTYRQGKVLAESATKRLSAIREFAEFGSGFKIAMRDLEIRGAGNVLGPEQSGFLLSVGYDLYLKLLEEAVLTQQGLPLPFKTECAADLSIAASVPTRYVSAEEQRLDLYRRIAAIRCEADADDLVDELIDRYGEPPQPVNNLISVALLRASAAQCKIRDIVQKGGFLLFYLTEFDLELIASLCGGANYHQRLLFAAGEKPHLSLKLGHGHDVLRTAQKFVDDFSARIAQDSPSNDDKIPTI